MPGGGWDLRGGWQIPQGRGVGEMLVARGRPVGRGCARLVTRKGIPRGRRRRDWAGQGRARRVRKGVGRSGLGNGQRRRVDCGCGALRVKG